MTETGTTLHWRKSTYSGPNGDCVELADTATGVAVRHSKHPDRGMLVYTHSEWAAFLAGCKAGEFDDLS